VLEYTNYAQKSGWGKKVNNKLREAGTGSRNQKTEEKTPAEARVPGMKLYPSIEPQSV